MIPASTLTPQPGPAPTVNPPADRSMVGQPALDLSSITPAERTVLELLSAGYSNKEIAAALDKAEPTVKHQVSSILRKAGVPSRARLIALWR